MVFYLPCKESGTDNVLIVEDLSTKDSYSYDKRKHYFLSHIYLWYWHTLVLFRGNAAHNIIALLAVIENDLVLKLSNVLGDDSSSTSRSILVVLGLSFRIKLVLYSEELFRELQHSSVDAELALHVCQ